MSMRIWVTFWAVLSIPFAFGAEKPSPNEVNKIVDYYENGASLGPVLVDAKICADVSKEGGNKNQCVKNITSNSLGSRTPAYLWFNLIVPKGVEKDKLLVQFEHQNITRQVSQLQIQTGLRYRTWTKFALDREGSWSVNVMYDNGESVRKLASIPVSITSNASAAKSANAAKQAN